MTFLAHAEGPDLGIPRSTRNWTVFGCCFMAVTILAFGLWANVAQIPGAVISPGVFVTTGENKTIQHLEGGVIRTILVHEGDVVEPGQT